MARTFTVHAYSKVGESITISERQYPAYQSRRELRSAVREIESLGMAAYVAEHDDTRTARKVRT